MKNHKSRLVSILLALIIILSGITPIFASNIDKNNNDLSMNSKLALSDEDSLKDELQSFKDSDTLKNFLDDVGRDNKLRVAVELKESPILDRANSMGKSVKQMSNTEINSISRNLENSQEAVKNSIRNNDIELYESDDKGVSANFSFTTIFNGFSTYVKAEDLEKLTQMDEVKEVYLINEFNRPKEISDMYSSNGMVGADISRDLGYKGEGMVVSVLDSGYDIAHKDFNISDNTNVALSESSAKQKINAFSLPGKYYTKKFPYAYNYYDKTDNIKSNTSNHGQHVAGTVAANGEVKGVAPEAQLLGMKVFSDDPLYSTTFSDVYAKAIDDSIKLGADALNMSLGSPAGSYYFGSLEDIALTNARKAGIVVTISAGNEHSIIDGVANFSNLLTGRYALPFGKNVDTGVLGSPSVYNGDISVASVNNVSVQKRIMKYTIGDTEYEAQISPASGSPNVWEVFSEPVDGSEIVYINGANKGPGSNAPGDKASFNNNDVEGKIVLVERGNAFTDTIVNAQEKGAKAVIIYNNRRADEEQLINMAGGDLAQIPFLMITRSNGLRIIENLNNIIINFIDEVRSFDNPQGNLISDFSSWGTSPELQLKPELTTPGGNIYSLDNDDGYTDMSGTSMAAPHAAGGAALVSQRIIRDSQIFGNLSKTEVGRLAKILLLNTAKPLTNENGDLYLIRQQGAGLMNLGDALTIDTYVVEKNSAEAKAEVGSFTDSKITMDFVIYNKSKNTRKFEISANALKDAKASDGEYEYLLEESEPITDINVIGGGNVVVPSNGKKEVRVTIDLSKAIEKGLLEENNFVEGFVFFKSIDGNKDMSVPYLGFYGDFESLHVLDEPLRNLLDDDPTNDPFMTATRLYYVDKGRITYAAPTLTPSYINPDLEGEGNSGVILRFTALRNYDRIEFTIEDEDGNVLENLGKSGSGRKIINMDRGQAPYTVLQEGYWDGKINNVALKPNVSVYYTVKAFFKADSKPQVMKFEVQADNSMPYAKDINGDWRTRREVGSNDPYYNETRGRDLRLSYDKETKEISFEAKDENSGVYSIALVNPATLNSANPTYKIWEGNNLDKIRTLIDKDEGIYKYTIKVPDGGFNNEILTVEISDKATNTIIGAAIRDDIEIAPNPNISVYSFNENTRIVRLFVKAGDSIALIPFINNEGDISLDIENAEYFNDDDKDGIIDAKISKKYKVGDAFAVVGSGSLINFVTSSKNDLTIPLTPIIDPIIRDDDEEINVEIIKGYVYESDLKIVAYNEDQVIGEAISDDEGRFEINLDQSISSIEGIKVVAIRTSTNVSSLPQTLSTDSLRAPLIDDNVILPGQQEVSGNAFIANADVVFEKESDEDHDKHIEFRRVKSGSDGRFLVNELNLEAEKLDLGDNVYIYVEKDGRRSEPTIITIGHDQRLQGPTDDLTMFINNPALLEGYRGDVPFRIVLFGWDNIDRITFGDRDLPFTINNYQRVIHPQNGNQVFYGKVFNVEADLDLEEGYYEVPITAFDDKNDKKFALTRRFWVDKTPATIDIVSELREEVTEEDGIKTITLYTDQDNINYIINYKDNGPSTELYRGDVKLNTTDVTRSSSGFKFVESEGSYNETIKLNSDIKEVKYDYEVYDIAGNVSKIRVKINREIIDETPNGKAPIIEASDINAYVGEKINLLDKVKAVDYKGTDITNKISVNPSAIDTSKPGRYEVKYSVYDTDMNFASKTINVIVRERENDLIEKDELIEIISRAEGYNSENYTLASYQSLREAIEDGKYLLKSISLTKEEVSAQIVKINKAIEDLVDISKLRKTYDYAKDIVTYEEDYYTDDSFEALKIAVENGRVILAKENATRREVTLALARINQALNNLKIKVPVNYDELEKIYNSILAEIENIGEDVYTEESLDNLREVLDEVYNLLNIRDASQEEVDNSLKKLITAYDELIKIEEEEIVNKDALRLLYDELIDKDLTNYTDESRDNFIKALENAYEILLDEEASQEEVDNARTSLEDANQNLIIKEINKSVLKAQVEAFSDLDEKSYTIESFKVFKEALDNAIAILNNENVSQEDVDNASLNLQEAFEALIERPLINTSLLEEEIKRAKDVRDNTQMTLSAEKSLDKEIEIAESILNEEDITQEEINEATSNLKKEVDRILKEETDLRKILEELIKEGDRILNDRSYPQASKRLLNSKVTNAKAVLRSPGPKDATLQSNIDILKEELKKFK